MLIAEKEHTKIQHGSREDLHPANSSTLNFHFNGHVAIVRNSDFGYTEARGKESY